MDPAYECGFLLVQAGRGSEQAAGVTVAIKEEVAAVADVKAFRHSGRFLKKHFQEPPGEPPAEKF